MAKPKPSALERLRALDQPEAAPAGPAAPAGASRRKRGVLAGGLIAVGLALAKFKTAIWILLTKGKLLLAAMKLGKFAVTGWSMLLTILLYSRYYGAAFAVGLVVLTLVHELGHGAAAGRIGLPVGAPIFIPFFGAMISLRARPRSTWEDFYIGAGGPLAGSAGGALCVLASFALSGHFAGLLCAIGYFALVLNLFNLMPVWQLDGARMCAAVRVRDGVIGVAVLGVATIGAAIAAHRLNPIALFVAAVGGYRFGVAWWRTGRKPAAGSALERLSQLSVEAAAPQATVTSAQHRAASLVYFGLAAALIIATHALELRLPRVAL